MLPKQQTAPESPKTDVLFKLKSLNSEGLEEAPTGEQTSLAGIEDPGIWRTFSSPGNFYRLFGHEDGHLLVVGPRDLAPGVPWRHIPSCSENDHHSIATAWVDQLNEHGDFLRGALLSGCGTSSAFLEAVRQKGLASEWNQFRIAAIRNSFDAALAAKAIPLTAKRTHSARTADDPPKTMRELSAAQPSESNRFREIILAAIKRMSDEELRKLLIPAGYMADNFETSIRS